MTYFLRSLLTFLLLYGLVAGVVLAAFSGVSLSLPWVTGLAIALIVAQYLVGPWIIRLLLDIEWNAKLPPVNRQFLTNLCRTHHMPVPPVGVIRAAMPNAFTFGRVQSDARIVVTQGLLDALTPEEVNVVIAHEVGHIKHWDFLTMTVAAIAPLLLYQLYGLIRRFRDDYVFAGLAYEAYWISELMVLALSRTREYWADRFAAEATRSAPAMTSALVKICYGMAKVQTEDAWARQHGSDEEKAGARQSALLAGKIGVMGISVGQSAFALTGPSPASAAAMMRWDLENPWARLLQLLSTHPLTAMRIRALNQVAVRHGQPVAYPLPEPVNLRWTGFPLELFLWAGPWILGILMVFSRPLLGAWNAVTAGLAFAMMMTWLVRIAFRYQGAFRPSAIQSLIENPQVSEMRPVPVRIEGEIAGKGEPGFFWSPDLLIKDQSGLLFVLNRQSIPLARLLLGFSMDKWIGHRVVLEGWYRRGVSPYVELSRLTSLDDSGQSLSSYSCWIQAGLAVLASNALFFLITR